MFSIRTKNPFRDEKSKPEQIEFVFFSRPMGAANGILAIEQEIHSQPIGDRLREPSPF